MAFEAHYEGHADEDEEGICKHRINPPPLQYLVDRTGFSKEWLQYMYREFKQKCPSGKMTDVDFLAIFRVLFPNSVGDSFARRLFLAFDRGSQDWITFEDVIITMWELNKRTPEAYSDFVMQLIDPHFRGVVPYLCYEQYIQSVLSLQGFAFIHSTNHNQAFPSSFVSQMTKQSFADLDTDTKGQFSVSDLEASYAKKHNQAMMAEINKGWGTVKQLPELTSNDPASTSTELYNTSINDENEKLQNVLYVETDQDEIL